ncbi:MAG: 2-dehydropantoate 2-reductase, partial [Blastochloris sp.]|nr:2-dehydropantoate 2-reductase [Blastochloris sp.]
MSIIIIGAGAIGLLVAGKLAGAGQRVIVVARPAAASTLTRHGLQITEGGHTRAISEITAISDPAQLAAADRSPKLVIVCVKGYDTTSTLPHLDAIAPQHILTLQNGIGNEEILAERFGAERVVSGTITTSVEMEEAGRLTITKIGGIGLAPVAPKIPIATCAETLRQAGFVLRTYPDYQAMKWSKALLNMLGNATAAILDMPVEAVYADRRLIAIERQAFLEALQVMRVIGIQPVNLPRYPAAMLASAMRSIPTRLLNPLLRRLIAGGRGGKPPSLHIDL